MNAKHTPGPWQRQLDYEAKDKRPPYNVWSIIGNTDAEERRHSVVATTITDDDDARLIAAAPDLLTQCKGIYFLLCQMDWPSRNTAEGQAILCNLRDVIQKAEGQS